MSDRPSRRRLTGAKLELALALRPAPAGPPDIAFLFDLKPLPLRKDVTRESARAIRPLPVRLTVERHERKIFIPGPPHVKKDGTVRDTLIPTLLVTVTVLQQSGTADPVALFRTRLTKTAEGRTVIRRPVPREVRKQVKLGDDDGNEFHVEQILTKWEGPRVPLCEAARELRERHPADADRIIAALSEILPGDRKPKDRPARTVHVPTGKESPGRTPEWMAKFERQQVEDAVEESPDVEDMTDEEFAAHTAGIYAAMDVTARAGTPEFYGN